ncbi:MAG: MFS transporter [Bacteriovoracia bacterium]
MSPRSIIRGYYAFQLFFSLLIWIPVFYEFQVRLGMPAEEIFGIQSIYYVVFCFLEFPTGYFADRYGYKRSLQVASLMLVLGNLMPYGCVYGWISPYAGMLASYLGIALARSFSSGATAAYLYEYLKGQGRAAEFKRVEGNARAYSLVGRTLVIPFAGLMMNWHLPLPYGITAVNAVVAGLAASWLPALPVAAPIAGAGPTAARFSRVTAAWLTLWRTPRLGLIMLQGIALFLLPRLVQLYLFQPLLQVKGLKVEVFGAIMSGMMLAEAVGSAQLLRRRQEGPTPVLQSARATGTILIYTTVICFSLVAAAYFEGWRCLASLGVFSFTVGRAFPIQAQLLNDAIPDSGLRASLLSVNAIFERGGASIVAYLAGQYVAAQATLGFLAVASLLTWALVLVIGGTKWRIYDRPLTGGPSMA